MSTDHDAATRRHTLARFCALLLLGCVAWLLPPGARAAPTGCSVSIPSAGGGAGAAVAFGSYDPLNASGIPTSGNLTINCSANGGGLNNGFMVTISLSTGAGTYVTRLMRGSVDTLQYNLYTDPSHTTVFGNGSAGSQTVTLCFYGSKKDPCGGTGLDPTQPHDVPMYGLLPPGQDVTAGSYTDTITAMLTF